MKTKRKIKAAVVNGYLQQLGADLKAMLEAANISDPQFIGVQTGGVWVAQWLHEHLRVEAPLGELNIAFYRDDFSRIGVHPRVQPSKLPFDVEGRHIVLIDDIVYTGRTIRAAMNEIFDYGRPASIRLLALVDRSGRELPVQADLVGTAMSLSEGEHVKLAGPEPLELLVQQRPGGAL
jgi:pyrimidine operon attenuation protein/uracil phosphoribosyltransferase